MDGILKSPPQEKQMPRRTRFVENCRSRRIIERWDEKTYLDEGVQHENKGYWTNGMTGFPRRTVQEVRDWIDQQEQG